MGKPNGCSTNDPNNFMPKGAKTDKIMSLAEAKRTKHLKLSTKSTDAFDSVAFFSAESVANFSAVSVAIFSADSVASYLSG